ncbi:MAG: choice-of-anchor Q domain-containing protein [Balneolaceae bacterium]|nr:choice-of-anchor Q domain-containing protein [Balneolaceae bacterium]
MKSTIINENPIFEDTSVGNYRLQGNSPAINVGTNSPFETGGVAEGITIDLAGTSRIYNSETVDIGAYEFQGEPTDSEKPIDPNNENILFVNINLEGGNESGDSWDNAIRELQRALNWAASDWNAEQDGTLQIWVAAGTYTPGEEGDQSATFQLVNHVEVYGGFDGNEESLENRDWKTHTTILSGDIDDNDDDFAPSTNSDENSSTPSQTDHISGNNSYQIVTGKQYRQQRRYRRLFGYRRFCK